MLANKTTDGNYSNENLTVLFLQDIKNQLPINWKVESSAENNAVIISPLINDKIGKIALRVSENAIIIEDIISIDGKSLDNINFQEILNSFLDNCICPIKKHDQFDIQMGDKYI